MKRTVIKIDENRCIGCGACVTGCHGGALQIVDGKAKVINELFCDGLGACIGECPVGALSLEERDAQPYHHVASAPLHQFPIQLRLVNPNAPFFHERDLILAADCTAFVCNRFHHQFMKENSIVIACPKLDNMAVQYVEKLTAIIESSIIRSLTVVLVEVPCCGGLWHIAQQALENARRKISMKKVVIGVNGTIQSTESPRCNN